MNLHIVAVIIIKLLRIKRLFHLAGPPGCGDRTIARSFVNIAYAHAQLHLSNT